MALPDISKLSYDELSELIKLASSMQVKAKLAEKAALLETFKAQAKAMGMTLEEIISIKSPRKTVAAKYRNPDDASQTWTGRGRKPLWVVEALENGASMDSLAI